MTTEQAEMVLSNMASLSDTVNNLLSVIQWKTLVLMVFAGLFVAGVVAIMFLEGLK